MDPLLRNGRHARPFAFMSSALLEAREERVLCENRRDFRVRFWPP
jgi:hypothetical protein